MASEKVKDEPTLYKPNAVTRGAPVPSRARSGRRFAGENPAPGAHVYYSLPQKAEKVTLEFQDIDGKKVGEVTAPAGAGLHRVTWNMASRVEGGAAGWAAGVRAAGSAGGRSRPARTASC
jgi:hypothetical protein